MPFRSMKANRLPGNTNAPRTVADQYDVVVVGGGNAALCAAISAREHSKRVLLVERAPEAFRGGNSRHTRDIRHAHADSDDHVQGTYTDHEFLDDLRRVSDADANGELAEVMVRSSSSLPAWMERQGVKWQAPLSGTLNLARTNRFFLGGGKALINTYYRRLAAMGTDLVYDATVVDIELDGEKCTGVRIEFGGNQRLIRSRAVIFACGGFEANVEWLKRYWGDAADNYMIRGPQYNDGTGLSILMGHGAQTVGNPKAFHSVAVDARGPKFDGGIVTRLDSIPFSIVVNQRGERFYDEGEDLWPKRYAIWGGLIAQQPGQIAYSIFDVKMSHRFMPPAWPPVKAGSIDELARHLEIPAGCLAQTIAVFNASVSDVRQFDPSELDGRSTGGLEPPKSNWAVAIDAPPYFAFPLRPGITFTYMGVAVDGSARVLRQNGRTFQNVYAAGEIMAGNILTRGYLAGTGLTIGTVFGIIAGQQAASHAA